VLLHGCLKLSIHERVEILADCLVVIGADDEVGAAGAGLQTGIERCSGIRPRIKIVWFSSSVPAGTPETVWVPLRSCS